MNTGGSFSDISMSGGEKKESVLATLREANNILLAARKNGSELLEAGISHRELHYFYTLIANVASYSEIHKDGEVTVTTELHELQHMKEVILRTVERKFGSNSTFLRDFSNL
jgi:hypothetical protein